MRLTLDLKPEEHRMIKSVAAAHGQSMKAAILSKFGLKTKRLVKNPKPKPVKEMDETDYLFSSPANAAHLIEEFNGKREENLRFDSLNDLKRALGN